MKHKITSVISVLLFLLLLFSGWFWYKAEDYYQVGNKEFENKKYDQAIKQYLKAIDKDPNFENAYYKIGRVYEDQDKEDKAEEYFKKALDITINENHINEEIYGHLYEFYRKANNHKALYELDSKTYHKFSNNNFVQVKRIETVELMLQDSENMRVKEKVKFLKELAILYEKTGNEGQSLANYKEILKYEPSNEIINKVAEFYHSKNNNEEAIIWYKKISKKSKFYIKNEEKIREIKNKIVKEKLEKKRQDLEKEKQEKIEKNAKRLSQIVIGETYTLDELKKLGLVGTADNIVAVFKLRGGFKAYWILYTYGYDDENNKQAYNHFYYIRQEYPIDYDGGYPHFELNGKYYNLEKIQTLGDM